MNELYRMVWNRRIWDLEIEFMMGSPTRHHRVENEAKIIKIGVEMSEI